MKAEITKGQYKWTIDLSKGMDLTLELSAKGARAWYVDPMRIAPVINRFFRGSVKAGGSVNFNDIYFNPHGHGTHTETVGHITPELVSINDILPSGFFEATLITVHPTEAEHDAAWTKRGDKLVTKAMLEECLGNRRPEALIVRTTPNGEEKRSRNYSSSNFPYFAEDACAWLAQIGIHHLLVDLPSVDREEDGGLLLAHRAFWQYPKHTRVEATITELIYADNTIVDGNYLVHLATASFRNDAAPSRVTIYAIE